MTHHEKLGKRLLRRRYEYYVLDDPKISDFEYDFIERKYENMCEDLGLESVVKDMVGYNENNLYHKDIVSGGVE